MCVSVNGTYALNDSAYRSFSSSLSIMSNTGLSSLNTQNTFFLPGIKVFTQSSDILILAFPLTSTSLYTIPNAGYA